MTAGRPKKADPGTLYAFAHQFYWDFRRLAEGRYRSRTNEEEAERLADEVDTEGVQLTVEQRLHLAKVVEEEIQEGRLAEANKETRLREVEADQLRMTRKWLRDEAARRARRQLKVPGEPDVLRALLQATKPEQVCEICEDAFVVAPMTTTDGRTIEGPVPNWPISVGSVLPMYLSQHAAKFIAAKKDLRFPQSGRPTSQLKQLWFLSRALAGAIWGIEPRTAINLVGSIRPEESFEQSRCAKPLRRKRRRRTPPLLRK